MGSSFYIMELFPTYQLPREEVISLLGAENRRQKLVLFIIIGIFIFILAGLTLLYLHIRRRWLADYNKLLNNNASLKMQNIRNRLSPHFLINMLSGLSVDVGHSEMVKRNINTISMLLRRSIENTEQTAIPLKEELEVVTGYIELQQLRIPQPFSFEYHISEGVNLEHLIPAMIIQIPVENAIKHGLLPMTGDKLLKINISPYEGGLQILIEDNGIGMSASSKRTSGTGIGLKVMIDTINLLNSKNAFKIVFSINSHQCNPESKVGTIVEIKVPTNYSFDF
jgi:LytS/YehU family sensor histidine kinase